MTALRLGARTSILDLHHQGRSSFISTGVLEANGGLALVDPGPEVCLPRLEEGLAELGRTLEEVSAILLTHIHLDHATAAGAIVARAPRAVVYVHPRGASHMIDPTRLLSSATRIYGDAMATLWGTFLPVPERSVVPIDEGDVVNVGDRRFDVAYTPGHAKHHVAFYEGASETAWVGDVGGIRMPGGIVTPVTPPPDIDVEAWNASMERVMAWRPARIVPAHFGPVDEPGPHFQALRAGLGEWADWVFESLDEDDGPEPDPAVDGARARAFAEWVKADLRAHMDETMVEAYTFGVGSEASWWGLARYWRKKAAGQMPAIPSKP